MERVEPMAARAGGESAGPAAAHEISAARAANWTGGGSKAAHADWRGRAADQASIQSNLASSGSAPIRTGIS
ncbi:MAG: hypothetical protein EBS56_11355, partial [Planctomycetia bacterium]|nr:hypothetical protein [Planctomycetia bacterium]